MKLSKAIKLPALLVAVAIAFTPAAALAAPKVWTKPLTLAQEKQATITRPDISVADTYAAATWIGITGSVQVAFSSNANSAFTWSKPMSLSGSTNAYNGCGPRVAVNAAGGTAVVWRGGAGIMTASKTSSSSEWDYATISEYGSCPDVAFGNGDFMVAWESAEGIRACVFSRCTPETIVSGYISNPRLAFDGTRLYVAYVTDDEEILVATKSGATWTYSIALSGEATAINVDIDANASSIIVAWQELSADSTQSRIGYAINTGSGWSSPGLVTSTYSANVNSPTVTANGYVLWNSSAAQSATAVTFNTTLYWAKVDSTAVVDSGSVASEGGSLIRPSAAQTAVGVIVVFSKEPGLGNASVMYSTLRD